MAVIQTCPGFLSAGKGSLTPVEPQHARGLLRVNLRHSQPCPECLLLGVKQTKSGAKRTLPLWERPTLWSDYFSGLVGFLVLLGFLALVPGLRPRPIFFASALRCLA